MCRNEVSPFTVTLTSRMHVCALVMSDSSDVGGESTVDFNWCVKVNVFKKLEPHKDLR